MPHGTMSSKLVLAFAGFALAGAPAGWAQEIEKVTVLFGASVSGIDRGSIGDSMLPSSEFPDRNERFTGFVFSPALTMRPYLRVVLGELAAQYRHAGATLDGGKERSTTFQLLFGPEFTKRFKRTTLFGHALVGFGGTQRSSIVNEHGVSENDFGVLPALGGGVDVNITRRYAVRVLQLDYLPGRMTRNQFGMDPNGSIIDRDVTSTRHNWRVTMGIVIHAGF